MRENELKIEEIEIDSLVPYENNAKKHTREQIDAVEASIKEFGFRNPVIVWRNADGLPEVVAGHARITAAKNLGMKKVPCVSCDDLSDAQRRALTLVDNQTTMMTGWDDDLLAYELDVLADEFDMGDFGFSEELEPDGLSAVEEDDPEPEVTICRAKRGDVFVLGNHRVMCGDSTCPEDVEKLCGGGLADMILTDPPYNVALGQHMRPSEAKQLRRRTDGLVIDNDEFKDEAQFEEFLYAALSAAVPHLKEGGAVYTWLAMMHMPAFASALARAGIMCKQMLVWVKNTFSLGHQDYQWRHEGCLYGWKPGAAHYFTDSRSESTVYEDLGKDPHKMSKAELIEMVEAMSVDSVATDVLHYDKPSRNEDHPTMKPVKLFACQMRNSSRKGETVLDPFGGSGTSVIAAEQMGRRCLCMELDPHYVDVIITRWENMTGREAVLETGEV